MKLSRIAAFALAASFTLPAFAAGTNKPLGNWTCEDFVAVQDQFKPKVVYWATAYNKGGKPEASVLDIEGTEKVTPAVIDACVKNPKASFWQTVKGEWAKLDAATRADLKKVEGAVSKEAKKVEKAL